MKRRRAQPAGDRVNLMSDPVLLTVFDHGDAMITLGAPNSWERTMGIVTIALVKEVLALRREFAPVGALRVSDAELLAWRERATREGEDLTRRFLEGQSPEVRRFYGVE